MNLVWLRNDLRLRDNPALWHAATAGSTEAIFFITPEQWCSQDMAASRVDFLLRTLVGLRRDLEAQGIALHVFQVAKFSDITPALLEFCRQRQVRALYWNNEYPIDEVARDTQVEQALRAQNIAIHRYHDRVIAPPGQVLKDNGEPYKVFTPFKKTWLRLLDAGMPDLFPAPPKQVLGSASEGEIPSALRGFSAPNLAQLWPAGEAEAARRLHAFCAAHLAGYDKHRDFPAQTATSTLSPYLAVGAISPQQCLVQAMMAAQAGAGAGAESWINELIWRDFYQHIAWHFPQVCKYQPFKPETQGVPWRYDNSDFAAWCEGRTGVPLVDAGMRQLKQQGWMHNRVRMVTAMYLSKNLLIDWRWGERFFMNQLVDGDFPANNGGWQWSASTGTDAAPYFRIFNPFTQGARFDPDGHYIKRYVPELQAVAPRDLHDPVRLQRMKPQEYPGVLVDGNIARQRVLAAFGGGGQ